MIPHQFSKLVRAMNDLTRHQQNHLFDELKSTLNHNKEMICPLVMIN